jgi:hypothetical protein
MFRSVSLLVSVQANVASAFCRACILMSFRGVGWPIIGQSSANIYIGNVIVCHESVFLPRQLIYPVIGHRICRILWGDPGDSADLKFSLRARYKYR